MDRFQTRCSPVTFCKEMENLRVLMRPVHHETISILPFGCFLDMPFAYASHSRLKLLISRFNVQTCSVGVGQDIDVPFTDTEFCIVNGLRHYGLSVDLHLKLPSSTLEELFGNDPSKCKKEVIAEMMKELVQSTDKDDVEDLCRLYVLFVFSTLLFPQSSGTIPRGLFCYVDDLSCIGEYAWGVAVYKFLVGAMSHYLNNNTAYVNGFVAGFMAWFYEHFPTRGCPTALRVFPRFFRWQAQESNLPSNFERGQVALNGIQRIELVDIVATQPRELQLFQPPTSNTNIESGTISLLREIVANQRKELKLLGKLLKKGVEDVEGGDSETEEISAEENDNEDEDPYAEDGEDNLNVGAEGERESDISRVICGRQSRIHLSICWYMHRIGHISCNLWKTIAYTLMNMFVHASNLSYLV